MSKTQNIFKRFFSKKSEHRDSTTAIPVSGEETRGFTTNVVISVTTGRLACEMDDIYEILDYLLSESLFTHDLARAARLVTPDLEEMFPWLKDLELPEGGGEPFLNAIEALSKEHGRVLQLPKLVNREFRSAGLQFVMEEAMRTGEPVVVVESEAGVEIVEDPSKDAE